VTAALTVFKIQTELSALPAGFIFMNLHQKVISTLLCNSQTAGRYGISAKITVYRIVGNIETTVKLKNLSASK